VDREPVILLIASQSDNSLEEALRHRYIQGYRITVVVPGSGASSELGAFRDQGEQIALIVYDFRADSVDPTLLMELSNALYPDARKALIADEALDTRSPGVARIPGDHEVISPWTPAERQLYPALDELLAEWRASVDMPFMRVKGIMTVRAVRVRLGDSLHRAAELIALSGIGDLMVIDDNNNFVGVLSVGDVLRAAMPDIEEIMEEGGTLEQAFRLFLRKGSELMYKPIEPLVISRPLVVDPDDHVAKVAALMLEKNIHRLPVVKDGRLIGTVGRTDICQAVVGSL
jgi:CBS domain-containing protein